METQEWIDDRVDECQALGGSRIEGDTPKAWYPGTPVVYWEVKNHKTNKWYWVQEIITTSNGVYQCLCSKAMPNILIKRVNRVNWEMVRESCTPLHIKSSWE